MDFVNGAIAAARENIGERARTDFDESGRAALEGAKQGGKCTCNHLCACALCTVSYAPLNTIWSAGSEVVGGGDRASVFVGSLEAASSAQLLDAHGITHIVNCMRHPREGASTHSQLQCLHFPVENWNANLVLSNGKTHATAENVAAARALFSPVMSFITSAVSSGGRVLIHCFAGAHRAGTVGVAVLMRLEGINVSQATARVRELRPVVDPRAHEILWAFLQMMG
jgi:predicted protein tyrosine phosphatase